jgi:hypothetical protein
MAGAPIRALFNRKIQLAFELAKAWFLTQMKAAMRHMTKIAAVIIRCR